MRSLSSLFTFLALGGLMAGCIEPQDLGVRPDGSDPIDAGPIAEDGGRVDSGPRGDEDASTIDAGPDVGRDAAVPDAGSDAATSDGGVGDAGAFDAGPPMCPDIFHNWVIEDASPSVNCGGIRAGELQFLLGDTSACLGELSTDTSPPGINGFADIDPSGGFTGASLTLNALPATECSGDNSDGFFYTITCGSGPTLCTILLIP